MLHSHGILLTYLFLSEALTISAKAFAPVASQEDSPIFGGG